MRNAVLSAVALLLVPAAISQTQVNTSGGVIISPHAALQEADPMNSAGPGGAPVRVHGTITEANTIVSRITVMNYSGKTVTSLEYGWRTSAPRACANSSLPAKWETAEATVNITTGDKATIKTVDALSKRGVAPELAAQARANNTPVVLVTIGIVKVTFADGSTWTDDEAVERNMFDNDLMEKQEACHSVARVNH
jgi:hypothetical protein